MQRWGSAFITYSITGPVHEFVHQGSLVGPPQDQRGSLRGEAKGSWLTGFSPDQGVSGSWGWAQPGVEAMVCQGERLRAIGRLLLPRIRVGVVHLGQGILGCGARHFQAIPALWVHSL